MMMLNKIVNKRIVFFKSFFSAVSAACPQTGPVKFPCLPETLLAQFEHPRIELIITSLLFQQAVMITAFDDLTLLQDHNGV